MKRKEALTRQLQVMGERVEPGAHGSVRIIKDEEFLRLQQMYRTALDKGEQRHCPFQPLTTYQHKIVRARPVLKGEVGVYGNEILTLEPGYGQGQLVQVGVDFGKEDSTVHVMAVLPAPVTFVPVASLDEVEAQIKQGGDGQQIRVNSASDDSSTSGSVDGDSGVQPE